jgi:pyrroline-5-carboxylate reductase
MSTKVGILGAGQMGEALILGLKGSEWKFSASTRSTESAKAQSKSLGIPVGTDNARVVQESDIVVLCVKPHQAEAVLSSVASSFSSKQLLISICAGVSNTDLASWSGGKAAIIRAMPNTPCLVHEGMTVFAPGPKAQKRELEAAVRIFSALGKTAIVEESLMDGVTGLSGCGPAYIFLVIEALSEAGVKVGLPRETATLLAAQTLLGSAKMVLERGVHPAALKDEVTTPAGCTIDGLMALEEGKLRVTMIKAVLAATKRSQKLSRK